MWDLIFFFLIFSEPAKMKNEPERLKLKRLKATHWKPQSG